MGGSQVTIWAVVPAAGLGRRFRESAAGTEHNAGFKQLARIGGRSMLAIVLDELEASRVAGVAAVVNAAIAGEISAERPITASRVYVVNPRPESEMIESIQLGLHAIRRYFLEIVLDDPGEGMEAVDLDRPGTGYLICPGDHPRVTRAAVDACIDSFTADTSALVVACHHGRRGHPLVVPGDLARQVAGWPATQGLNTLAREYPDRVREVEIGDPGVLVDVDTVGDLAQIRDVGQ